MFNRESFDDLKAQALKEKSSKKKEAEMDFLVNIQCQAVRFGMLLSHQARLNDTCKMMLQQLFRKNFPDTPLPKVDEMEEPLEDLLDQESGKHFGDIVKERIVDDWAYDESTTHAMSMLYSVLEQGGKKDFLTFISTTDEEMHQAWVEAKNMDAISETLN